MAVKFQLADGTSTDPLDQSLNGPDQLSQEMAARLVRGPVAHEMWVQIAGEGHDPHSATSVWKGCREMLAGRVVDGIELSDDPILRYRPAVYSESISHRS